MKDFRITRWSKDIMECPRCGDSGHIANGTWACDNCGHSIRSDIYQPLDNATVSFKAYDDDGNWYCDGIATDMDTIDLMVFDYLANGWGTTLIKIYDLASHQYLDSIG